LTAAVGRVPCAARGDAVEYWRTFMSNYGDAYTPSRPYSLGYQLDISAVMRQAFIWLALGLALGFGVAYAVGETAKNQIAAGQSPASVIIFNPVVVIIGFVAYLAIGFGFYPIVRRVNLAVGLLMYFVFAAVFGFMISSIFVVYSLGTIAWTFLATAGMFGVMAVIGYTTRINLARIGAIAIMALIGIILASIVNFFLQSPVLYWIVTYATIVIFSVLTARDVQWIKTQGAALASSGDESVVGKVALLGAFRLFLDFVNLFLALLRIFGRGRS
jgi:hypothetical protein